MPSKQPLKAAPETLVSRPTARYRHTERTANRQLHLRFHHSTATAQDLQPTDALDRSATVQPLFRIPTTYQLLPLCCIASGI
jgi:hypothetical protein